MTLQDWTKTPLSDPPPPPNLTGVAGHTLNEAPLNIQGVAYESLQEDLTGVPDTDTTTDAPFDDAADISGVTDKESEPEPQEERENKPDNQANNDSSNSNFQPQWNMHQFNSKWKKSMET